MNYFWDSQFQLFRRDGVEEFTPMGWRLNPDSSTLSHRRRSGARSPQSWRNRSAIGQASITSAVLVTAWSDRLGSLPAKESWNWDAAAAPSPGTSEKPGRKWLLSSPACSGHGALLNDAVTWETFAWLSTTSLAFVRTSGLITSSS